MQAWLDAWENAGDVWPSETRAWIASAAPGPQYMDRFFAGVQNAIAETMARQIETAWRSPMHPQDTPGGESGGQWEPAPKVLMNGLGVRRFDKTPDKRQRWAFKDYVKAQVPSDQQGDFGTVTNRVDFQWLAEGSNTGYVDWRVRVVVVGDDGMIGVSEAPVTPPPEDRWYDGDDRLREARADIGVRDVGDLVLVQIDRDAENAADDTLDAPVGLAGARVV